MSLFTDDSIERLKQAVDMVELVGARTDLRRVGSRWTGLCPFHDERTPSFSVNAEDGLYHCFGCGAGGDAIKFVRETEGRDFPEAVELLAERFGVRLERQEEDPRTEERRRRRERLRSLLDRAASFYAAYLWDSAEGGRARTYLLDRGLPEQTLRDFRVGYSPTAWDALLTRARRQGFSERELADADLVRKGRGGLYDRFRGRIMFPLADARGRVLGFGARMLGEGEGAKYVNTSEGELFHKRRQLFGIERARTPAARSGRIVVVEGYTDVLALHGAGIEESVAIMGTALTQEQLSELARAVGKGGRVFLALDADASGQEAMLRASRGASALDAKLLVAQLPEGSDPADLVAAGGVDAVLRPLQRAVGVLEFEVRRVLQEGDLTSPAGRDSALKEALRVIAQTPGDEPAGRAELVRYVSDRLDLPVEYLMDQLTSTPPPSAAPRAPAPDAPAPRPAVAVSAVESEFLALSVAAGEPGRAYLQRAGSEHFSSETMRRARDHLAANFDDPLAGLPEEDPVLAAQVTAVAMRGQEETVSDATLEMSYLQLERRRIEAALRRASRDGDLAALAPLSAELQDNRRKLDEMMGQTV